MVCDAIVLQKKYDLVGFADAALPIGTEIHHGFKVVCPQEPLSLLKSWTDYFVVAIGRNETRAKVYTELKSFLLPGTVIHPTAVIGSAAKVGIGSVVLANAVVNTGSSIGENSIINCRSVVDHDCKVGSHVHLSIGTMLGSNSTVADRYLSGIGENINSFSKIG